MEIANLKPKNKPKNKPKITQNTDASNTHLAKSNNNAESPTELAKAPLSIENKFDFDPKPFKDFAVKLMEANKYIIESPDPGDGKRKNAVTSPEIIRDFETLVANQLLPFYKSVLEGKKQIQLDPNQEYPRIDMHINTHFKKEKHPQDQYNFKLRSYWPKGELSKADIKLRDMALEFSLNPYADIGLRTPVTLPDITIIDEKEPLVKTKYDTQGVKPIRRIIMTFHDPDHPSEILELTYNAGKWLCGKGSCPRELQIVEKKVDEMDKLVNVGYKRFIDPKQNKMRGPLLRKIQGAYPAPVSLAA